MFSIPTTCVLSVLAGYFGGKAIQGVFNYVVSAFKGESEIPLSIKLYPKTSACLLLLAGFCAYFSTGTAEQLVRDNFSESNWKKFQPFLSFCARYGMQIFGMVNSFEVIMNLIKNTASSYGGDDEKAAIALHEKIIKLQRAIFECDGSKLEQDLQNRDSDTRQRLLRMPDDEFDQLLQHGRDELEARTTEPTAGRTEGEENGSWFSWCKRRCFFGSSSRNERQQLVVPQSGSELGQPYVVLGSSG